MPDYALTRFVIQERHRDNYIKLTGGPSSRAYTSRPKLRPALRKCNATVTCQSDTVCDTYCGVKALPPAAPADSSATRSCLLIPLRQPPEIKLPVSVSQVGILKWPNKQFGGEESMSRKALRNKS